MKDPQRLLDTRGSSPELALLRAADAEEPSELGKQQLAAALGIALGVSAATGAAAASQATAGTGAVATKVAAAKLTTPWLAALVGGAMLTGAAVTYVAVRPDEKPPLAVTVTTAPKLPRAAVSGGSRPPVEEPAATALEALPLEEAASEPVARSAGAVPSSDPKSIAREIAALDSVRRALAGGQPQTALKQLADYGRSHPRGVLRQEATLLRIEALAASGDRAAAKRLADRFLSDNSTSPHAKRVRALIGSSP